MPPKPDQGDDASEADRGYQRRLTAILSVDVKDYSRLMEQDETRTVGIIKSYRKILADVITRNRGRVVDATGDNLLASFSSAVDAVTSALAIQDEINPRNQSIPDDRKMLLRIGVNLGDVIVDDNRIYGDGVNIAARLEGQAPAGGICISGNVYDQIQNRMTFGCTYRGRQTVKNIQHPVRVYEIHTDPDARECKTRMAASKRLTGKKAVIAAMVGVAIIALSFAGLKLIRRPVSPPIAAPSNEQADAASSERAAIAVLPFTNLNPDGPKYYLADGITNDIITDLSKFKALSVAASNSVFRFKGKAVDVNEVARHLNVTYIVEGSVQADDSHIRINAQLIDAATGKHLWANRYDRKLESILTLQNAIVETIVRNLTLNIDQIERSRAVHKKTENLNAYDQYLRGLHHMYRRSRQGMTAARQAFKTAIKMDPQFGSAHLGLAEVRILDAAYGYTEFPSMAMQEAESLLKKALLLEAGNTEAMAKLAYVYMRRGAYDLATSEAEKALDINPNDWRVYRVMAPVLLYSGQPDQALDWYLKSLKYDPYVTPGLYMNIGICYYLQDQHDQAVQWLSNGVGKWPDFLGYHIVLASLYGHTDDTQKAAVEVKQIQRISPFFELKFYGKAFRKAEHRKRLVNGLRKAGLN